MTHEEVQLVIEQMNGLETAMRGSLVVCTQAHLGMGELQDLTRAVAIVISIKSKTEQDLNPQKGA